MQLSPKSEHKMISNGTGNPPIALFVYKRPNHTHRVLQSLSRNTGFEEFPLYIFCDAAKNIRDEFTVQEARDVVGNFKHPNKFVIERNHNYGLARSIIDGVTRLCSEYGTAIVLEDDLEVAPGFLDYMRASLDKYADVENVMQVSGYMFPIDISEETDAHFMPVPTSWGWAIWDRAWKKFDPEMNGYEKIKMDSRVKKAFNLGGAYDYFNLLELQRAGKIDSWAIRWYLNVFLENGLTLYPATTLVENHGMDGSGTHCGDEDPFRAYIDPGFSVKRWPSEVKVSENWPKVTSYIRECNTYGPGIKSMLKRLIKKIAS